MTNYRLAPVEDDATETIYAKMCSESYAVTMDEIPPWFARCGRENMRVLVDGDDVVAGLMRVPMGLYLGGRSLSMNGLAGVAVRPDVRGKGAATAMMRRVLAEMRDDGYLLSGLNGSTFKLYRSVGYEAAWSTCEVSGPIRNLGRLHAPLHVRHETAADRPALVEMYDAVARHRHGALDRGPYVWARLRNPRDSNAVGYVVHDDAEAIRGFAYIERKWSGRALEVKVTDWFAVDHDAAMSLLALVSGEGALAEKVTFPSWPNDPMYALLPERGFEMVEHEPGMVRVLDLAGAFAGRGYADGARGRLELEVTDDLFEGNRGRWIVDVADGSAAVERGGSGALKVDARGMAPLLTGHLTPSSLRVAGRLQGSDADVAAADRLLTGPAPSLPEFF